MRSTLSDWEVALARWLKPFLERLRLCPITMSFTTYCVCLEMRSFRWWSGLRQPLAHR